MGAWGYGVFDDDSSYDVMAELETSNNICEYLEKAFDSALSVDYVGFDEGISVLVCAAVMDSILNNMVHRFDGFNSQSKSEVEGNEQYMNWIRMIMPVDCEYLKQKATSALTKTMSDSSELSELWAENTKLYPKWKNNVIEIIERLHVVRKES